MSFKAGDVIKKYVELRDRKTELTKRHEEELRPIAAAMEQMENWLMHQMNNLGVDQLKGETGTAYRSVATSVQLKEPGVFKEFVLAPAVTALTQLIESTYGASKQLIDRDRIGGILRDLTRWDIVDFRAGKKGIQEFQEAGGSVPGIAINSIATVNIRRA